MGARAVRAFDIASRASTIALLVSAAAIGWAAATDWGLTVPLETAIRRDLDVLATPEALEARARTALDADDVTLARGVADLGAGLGRPLRPETLVRLAAAEAPAAVAWRSAQGFAHGFVSGEIDGQAALVGALVSDLTLVGDIRDLASEGGKAIRGEDHSTIILGLAAAGAAATAATYATAGAGAPARVGVSVLKAARRTGTMTAEFAADLGRRMARTSEAAGPGAARAGQLALGAAAGELAAVGRTVGAAETVRLMRSVRSVDEISDLRRFTTRFGARSRAVAEVTGKTSLRAFRTTLRIGELLLRHLLGFAMWFGGLLIGALSRFGFRLTRVVCARL